MAEQPQLPALMPEATPEGAIPLCSPGLAPLLTASNVNEAHEAVRNIARRPALLEECRLILPALEAALAPSVASSLIEVLVEESAPFGLGARKILDDEWTARWAPYLRALEGMSVALLRAAFVSWNRCEMYPDQKGRHAFYPQPAELFALAQQHRSKVALMRYRARQAMKYEAERPPPKRERMTKADMIAAGFLNPDGSVNMKPRTVAHPTPPTAAPEVF